MKASEVQVGKTYLAKVSGRVCPVSIIRAVPWGGYDALNTATGRLIRIRSARRLRAPVPEKGEKDDVQ